MKNYKILVLILIISCILYGIYKTSTQTYINAKFPELRPHSEKLPVYYKGIVIGKALRKKHSNDYKHTIIKIVLYKNNLLLPKNTTVYLKKEKRNKKEKDFLELIYPKNPSKIMLSNGSTINGIATVDIDTFMSNHHPNDLEEIKENLLNSSQNLSIALKELGNLLVSMQKILNKNSLEIKKTTTNVAKITQNINSTTSKINNAVREEEIEEIFKDIKETSANINSTIKETNELICNLNAISCGIRKTLSKKFGTLKLFFSKPIE